MLAVMNVQTIIMECGVIAGTHTCTPFTVKI